MTDRQVSKVGKAFVNNSSANIKLPKMQLSKIVQLQWFLGGVLGSLPTTGLPLVKNILTELAKRVLVSLELTAVVSATGTGIHKKILGTSNKNKCS